MGVYLVFACDVVVVSTFDYFCAIDAWLSTMPAVMFAFFTVFMTYY